MQRNRKHFFFFFGKAKVEEFQEGKDVSTASNTAVRSVEDGAEKSPVAGNF